MHGLLEMLCRLSAIAGGIAMVGITLITTGSIVGRNLFGTPLLGDTEIVEEGIAFAVASFMPICQWRGSNIIVDFFTTKASDSTRALLDRIGALTVATMMGLVAWRTVVGAISEYQSGSTSMLMQWPVWQVYAAMVPSLVLAAVLAIYTALTGRNGSTGSTATA